MLYNPVLQHRPKYIVLLLLVTIFIITSLASITMYLPAMHQRSQAKATNSATNGLLMSLYVPPAVSFLSELLPVTVSLHNQSNRMLNYYGWPYSQSCASMIVVTVTGGSRPFYPFLHHTTRACGLIPPLQHLASGQTLQVTRFVPLTASGRVTITAHAYSFFHLKSMSLGVTDARVVIHVTTQVPISRILYVQYARHEVTVVVAHGERPRLLYQDYVVCTTTRYKETVTRGQWLPVPAGGIHPPDCNGSHKEWYVSIGSPGFAIASMITND